MSRFLPDELPRIAGRVRAEPEDFRVDEELLYEPSGEGTHLWLHVEKRARTTFSVARELARAFGRREAEIGYAGLKDKHAVTRQWFSVGLASETDAAGLELAGARVVAVTRHPNKLKLGHLKGNHFVIRVRDAGRNAETTAREGLAILARRGVPNRFGMQRFGRDGSTPELGRLLLAEDWDGFLARFAPDNAGDELAARARRIASERGAFQGVRALPRRFLSLCTASLQAHVFNLVLDARLATLDEVLEGDIAYLHRNGACFLVEDAAAEAQRLASFEISPSGPLPGPSCLRPSGEPERLEAGLIGELGVSHERFDVRRPWAQKGGRRPLRVPLTAPSARAGGADIVLSFALPAGSYATAVLDELLETPPT